MHRRPSLLPLARLDTMADTPGQPVSAHTQQDLLNSIQRLYRHWSQQQDLDSEDLPDLPTWVRTLPSSTFLSNSELAAPVCIAVALPPDLHVLILAVQNVYIELLGCLQMALDADLLFMDILRCESPVRTRQDTPMPVFLASQDVGGSAASLEGYLTPLGTSTASLLPAMEMEAPLPPQPDPASSRSSSRRWSALRAACSAASAAACDQQSSLCGVSL